MRRMGVLALVLVTALPAMPDDVAAAPAVRPTGTPSDPAFADTLVATVNGPVAVTALPDGRAVVLEKGGRARIIRNGSLLASPALVLTVCGNNERGLLGFAPDPDFGSNGYVYVYYTRPAPAAPGGCVNRVSRFVMRGNTVDRSTEVVLLDNIGSPAGNHNGGDVAVGNDGYLYVSVGDGGSNPRGGGSPNTAAQDLSLLNGKILRINRFTGAPAAGNPLRGVGTAVCRTRGNTPSTPRTRCQEIFAWGLRNPWRFAFDPNTGATRFFINDVGQSTREEVDLGRLGANYGWPAREGVCPYRQNPPCAAPPAGSGFVQPITDYGRAFGSYVTGGAFVPNGAWPAAYDGGYVFADGAGSMFFRNAAGAVSYASPFVTGVGGISDIEFVMEPRGWVLYYVLFGSGQVRRLAPTQATPAPTANLAYRPVTPARVFDSRALGGRTGPLRAGTSRLVKVAAVPGAHRAALVNITLVRPTAAAVVTAWQPRSPRPTSTNVFGPRQQLTANASIVPIDAQGNILLFTTGTGHVVVDLLGYFDAVPGGQSQAGRYEPVTPRRAVDTRRASSATNLFTRTNGATESVVNVPLAGRFGLDATVQAVALMVTGVAGTSSAGHVVVHPHGGAVPATANLTTNGPGDVRGNLVVVPLGGDGSVDLRLRRTQHVVVEVVGSFTDAAAALSAAGTFVAFPARRVVDTRTALGFSRLPAGGTGSVDPTGVPADALGVAQNIAMVDSGGPGYITAYPAGLATVPLVANGNVTAAGQTRTRMAITPLGAGVERFRVSVATDVVVDVTGYFNAS